jgi:hypothetical protein
LGGVHSQNRPGESQSYFDEEPEYITLLMKAHVNKQIVARVQRLAHSEDQWLREAARIALQAALSKTGSHER